MAVAAYRGGRPMVVRCAAISRNPREITVSAVVRTRFGTTRRDPRDVTDELRAYRAAGCPLAVVDDAYPGAAEV